jgi:hypothetical protein
MQKKWEFYVLLGTVVAVLLSLALSIAALAVNGNRFRCTLAEGSVLGFSALTLSLHNQAVEFRLRYALPPAEGGMQRAVLRGPRTTLDPAPVALILCGDMQSCAALEAHSCLSNQLPEDCGEFSRQLTTQDTGLSGAAMHVLLRQLEQTPHLFYLAVESAATPAGAHFSQTLGAFCEL